jgi:lipopolysaccharide export LptBFGC system permease protein LptF
MVCIQSNPSSILVVAVLLEQHVAPLEQELDKTKREMLQAKTKETNNKNQFNIEGSSRHFTEVDQQSPRTAQAMTIIRLRQAAREELLMMMSTINKNSKDGRPQANENYKKLLQENKQDDPYDNGDESRRRKKKNTRLGNRERRNKNYGKNLKQGMHKSPIKRKEKQKKQQGTRLGST